MFSFFVFSVYCNNCPYFNFAPIVPFHPHLWQNSLPLCKAKRKKPGAKLTLYTVFKCCHSKMKVGTSWLDPHRISSRPHTARWSGRWWWRRLTPGRPLGRAGTPPSCSAGSWRLWMTKENKVNVQWKNQ